MDFATIGGIVAGLFLIIRLGIGDPAKIAMFIDARAVAITIGGMISAMFIAYPLSTLLSVFSIVKNAFIPTRIDSAKVVTDIVGYSERSRREGILSLETNIHEVEDRFLRKGLQLAVDGTDGALIREILSIDLENMEARHKHGIQFFDDAGTLAPAFGMVGTLVGLVMMLGNMSDPSAIGPAMAVALITTFYGAFIANMFCIPIAVKLKNLHVEEHMVRTMMLEGVLSLQNGENPRLVESKMLSFLSPDARLKVGPPKYKENRIG